MTICRTRPKYLDGVDILNIINDSSSYEYHIQDGLYLDSGSNAFRFFLESFSLYYNKTPKVAIQAFTCKSMLDAIIDSNSVAYIYDINLKDLSISYRDVDFDEIDILVLTCYQGIPCLDYSNVSDVCRKHNVILFEDLCHGKESSVDNIKLGTLCNAFIEAYTFDKPFTCIEGGKLFINEMNSGFVDFINERYMLLPCEPEHKAIKQIKQIPFLLEYTKSDFYNKEFDYKYFIEFPFLSKIFIIKLSCCNFYVKIMKLVYKVCSKMFSSKKKFVPQRLDLNKIKLIRVQEENNAMNDNTMHDFNLRISSIFDINNEFECPRSCIVWNRYSVLDADGMIKDKFLKKGIDVGNFNWSYCINENLTKETLRNVRIYNNCPNSIYVSRNIVNIPIWHLVVDLNSKGKRYKS
ncbi:MAG: DegT/DnrJ/EryC1/StrS aminotransferase family protein [Dorea sp.]|nr:DegT/DnrJ/EryC1/StrS aminotransferase family protein [Dorea sp.]